MKMKYPGWATGSSIETCFRTLSLAGVLAWQLSNTLFDTNAALAVTRPLLDGEQAPLIRDALEGMRSAIAEL